jgi:hypothetical protein
MKVAGTKPKQHRGRRAVSLMSKAQQTFKQGDVTKAVKGAQNAGLTVQRLEIDKAGKIVVFVSRLEKGVFELVTDEHNPWDGVE